MSDDQTLFGPRLAKARQRAGLNKNQLARELGTSWQHVDNWERGRVEPSLASARRLAEILFVSADYLLGLTDEPAARGMSALARYMADLAPADLSPTEEQWLRDAPVDHASMLPKQYTDLLESLRKVSAPKRLAQEEATPAKSGVRGKVDRRAVNRAVAASERGKPKKTEARSKLSHALDRKAVARAVRKKKSEG